MQIQIMLKQNTGNGKSMNIKIISMLFVQIATKSFMFINKGNIELTVAIIALTAGQKWEKNRSVEHGEENIFGGESCGVMDCSAAGM